MVRKLQTCMFVGALSGALALDAAPVSAAILTLPFVGDIEHPDMDPFHVVTPEAPAAAAPTVPKKKHHRHRRMKTKKA